MGNSANLFKIAAKEYAESHYTNSELRQIEEGTHSKTWKLSAEEGNFVVRVNRRATHFERDLLISENLCGVEVPEVIDIAKSSSGMYVCVSRFIAGRNLANYSAKQLSDKIKMSFVNNLMNIHRSDMATNYKGYGKIINGKGENSTWQDFLEGIYKNSTVAKQLDEITKEKFVKPATVQKAITATKELLERLDDSQRNIKHLLHGDYQPYNIISSKRGLVIIDWGNAKLGDFAYDLVWTAMHPPQIYSLDELLRVYEDNGFDMDNMEERVALCKISVYVSWMINSFNNDRDELVRDDVNGLERVLSEL